MHLTRTHRRVRRGLVLALLAMVLAPLGLLIVPSLPAQAQSDGTKTFYYPRVDVDITVNKDGSFDAVETEQFQYTSGTFQGAFRGWDTSRVEDYQNIGVREVTNGQAVDYTEYRGSYDLDNGPLPPANTFITRNVGNEFRVYWF